MGELEALLQASVRNCMAEQGYDYYVPDVNALDDWVSLAQFVDVRSTYGYYVYISPPAPSRDQAAADAERISTEPDYVRALTGDATGTIEQLTSLTPYAEPSSVGGCQRVGLEAIADELPQISYDLRAEFAVDYLDLPDFPAAERRWAACINTEGWGVAALSDPEEIVMSWTSSAEEDPAELARRELRLATLDAECWIREIHPVTSAAEEAAIRAFVERYPDYREFLQ